MNLKGKTAPGQIVGSHKAIIFRAKLLECKEYLHQKSLFLIFYQTVGELLDMKEEGSLHLLDLAVQPWNLKLKLMQSWLMP